MKFIKHILPAQQTRYNGVPVPRADSGYVPWRTRSESNPTYEQALIAAIKEGVEVGNRVTIIGGGYGVSAVIAAECAGENGDIVCFEAAGEAAARAKETVAMNEMADRVTIKHAVVETAGDTRGNDLGKQISFSAIDCTDVLVIDVDGAELALLEEVADGECRPRTLIVEHHATPDGEPYRPDEVKDVIVSAGYGDMRVRSRAIPPAYGGEESVFVARRSASEVSSGV